MKTSILALFVFIFALTCSSCENNTTVVMAIKTVSEYGTYFGLKQTNLDEEKAKYVEEALRVLIQVIDKESLSGTVDMDKITASIPAQIKPFVEKALFVVETKYSAVRGKLSADKAVYVRAVLEGAFVGTEKYRASLKPGVQSSYETDLIDSYNKAIKEIE
jgi:hypothetical protein